MEDTFRNLEAREMITPVKIFKFMFSSRNRKGIEGSN